MCADVHCNRVCRSRWCEYAALRDGPGGRAADGAMKCSRQAVQQAASARWVLAMHNFDELEAATRRRLDGLAVLQRQYLLPHFAACGQGEGGGTDIATATLDVQRLLKELERLVSHGLSMREGSNDEEGRIVYNARRYLSTRLHNLVCAFRRGEEDFAEGLRRRDAAQQRFTHFGDPATHALVRQEERVARYIGMGYTEESEIADLLQADAREEAMRAEVQSIVCSLQEVQALFRDVDLMVSEQGSLLERIDYNIQQATVAVARAKAQLVRASQNQSSCSVM